MRKLSSVLLLTVLLNLPAFAAGKDVYLQNVFFTCIPDDVIELQTAPLKGYAEYIEGSDEIELVNDNNEFVLNLKVPQKIEPKKLLDLNSDIAVKKNQAGLLERYHDPEHTVSARGTLSEEKRGNFSFGTMYDASIDKSQMEYSTGLFTRYERSRFALSTAYKKTLLSTGGIQYDNLYFSPEIKLNKVFSLRDEVSADITRNRRANNVFLTIKPLKKDRERLKFELGAGQTFDQTNAIIYQQVKFNTTIKL